MEQKWLFGAIVVLLMVLSGTFGYVLANGNNQKSYFSNDPSNTQSSYNSQNTSLNSSNIGEHTLSVTGVGSAEGKPDSVQMRFGVITEVSKDVGADEAVNRNSAEMNQVIESLKEEGIREKDIETSSFNLSFRRDYTKHRERSEIIGYKVTHMLSVKTQDTSIVGNLIDVAVDSGANNVGSIVFTFSEDRSDELEALARERAGEDASNKAEGIANSLGVEVTGVYNVAEERYQPHRTYDEAELAQGDSTSIVPPSSLEKAVTLNVIFKIE
ncbi:hypothetical protein AKJ56_01915 [candidate division MSBL1 archaeon SCGC-AAA382N08]|uniref:SIMPL domain-containing protein n=1 Tax=candidate division MSBL1 archaeon SCGC-AAA382N08 TaxID=1698285 RepID=A0A133VNQ8_9EURY|nr:hypothetical protein AKJ56_01915 [candidate division MSBL1 archaeon SCGC-AAA382N08]